VSVSEAVIRRNAVQRRQACQSFASAAVSLCLALDRAPNRVALVTNGQYHL
jgi:hypothetical protein